MRKPDHHSSTPESILRWIVFLLLGLTALVITVNSFDSGMAKTPLLVLLASLLVVVYFSLGIWAGELKVRRSPADLPVLGFLALIVASALYSDSPGESVRALELWVPLIMCFFAGTHLFWNQEAVKRLTQALFVIASAVVLVGVIQFFFSNSLVLNFFIGADRRVSSTLTNSTYLSGYLVLLFPFFLTSAMSEPAESRMRRVLFALLGGLVFVLFVTSTRSSIAAFLVSLLGLVVLLARAPRKALVWGGSAVLLVALAVYLTPRLAERIETSFHDLFIHRKDPSQFEMLLFYFLIGFRTRFTLYPVDDQYLPDDAEVQFTDEVPNPRCGQDTPLAGIRDDKEKIHIPSRQPAEMLHPRFVIDHDILIITRQEIQTLPRQGIRCTITSGSLWSSHRDKVKSFGLGQGFLDLIFKPDVLGHPHRDIFLHRLTGFANGGPYLHAQDLVEVRIGIRVHPQDRAFSFIQEKANDHSCQGGFARSSFS